MPVESLMSAEVDKPNWLIDAGEPNFRRCEIGANHFDDFE